MERSLKNLNNHLIMFIHLAIFSTDSWAVDKPYLKNFLALQSDVG